MACVECGSEAPKYKCPVCLSKYCSVACCKAHKAKECTTAKKEEKAKEPDQNTAETSRLELLDELEDSEDFVHPDKLALLGESEEVKSLLYNPHLQSMLVDLVHSGQPARDMAIAMHEPLFRELADACLLVVENDDGDRDRKVAAS
ncbi:zinc finger HIT domain-containing protein 3-like [Babylonia areolata]|uniref:zinc finger HIT domain-containing protein 3-like n=1 Tax=Babylonia areolata TaxID=304850 RepID=UPI003FD61F1D